MGVDVSVSVITGDCLEVLRGMPEQSVHACVTDAPYGLTSKRPAGRSEATRGAVMKGFMGMAWDGAVPPAEVWREVYRVLKPGAHLLAFGGTRTYHRMVCAIEDAGFEIRDQIAWVYGSGFPKSHNLEGEWEGWGTALKPAWEPIVVARRPLIGTVAANVAAHGCGALNIDACRVGEEQRTYDLTMVAGGFETTGGGRNVKSGEKTVIGRWPANIAHDGSDEVLAAFPNAPGQIADASSSSSRKTQNVYGAMKRGNARDGEASADRRYTEEGSTNFAALPGTRRGDTGSAARFFYCAKASRADRDGGCARNFHPTVKPTALMRWLVRLVTPPGGTVLDPFAGSGSTGKACVAEGLDALLIEISPEYAEIARERITGDAPLFADVT